MFWAWATSPRIPLGKRYGWAIWASDDMGNPPRGLPREKSERALGGSMMVSLTSWCSFIRTCEHWPKWLVRNGLINTFRRLCTRLILGLSLTN